MNKKQNNKRVESIFQFIFSIPTALTILGVAIGASPLVPTIAKIVLKWRLVMREIWKLVFSIMPDWFNINISHRQSDLLTLTLVLVTPVIIKTIPKKLILRPILFSLKSIGIDNKHFFKNLNANKKIASVLVLLLILYMSMDFSSSWGIFRPIAALLVMFFLLVVMIIGTESNADGFTFFSSIITFFIMIGIPGLLILSSFDFFENDSLSFSKLLIGGIFNIIFIYLALTSANSNPKIIITSIILVFLILVASKLSELIGYPVEYITPYIDSLKE